MHAGDMKLRLCLLVLFDSLGCRVVPVLEKDTYSTAKLLVRELVRTQIPLEVCPTSNLRTRVAESMATHPVRTLIDEGAFVTLNTDDPAMFGCTLAGEYAAVAGLGYDLATMRMLAENAIDGSWAEPGRKRDLHVGLATWWQERTEPPVA